MTAVFQVHSREVGVALRAQLPGGTIRFEKEDALRLASSLLTGEEIKLRNANGGATIAFHLEVREDGEQWAVLTLEDGYCHIIDGYEFIEFTMTVGRALFEISKAKECV